MAIPSDAAESEPKQLLSKETALTMRCVLELPLQDGNQVTVLCLLEMIMYVCEAFSDTVAHFEDTIASRALVIFL